MGLKSPFFMDAMEKDTRLKLKGKITDYAVWDDTIDLHVEKFFKKHNVYPNILLANEFTYRRIDMFAQMHPERLIEVEGNETFETSNMSYNGISEFSTASYSLECCFDYELTDDSFLLIFDEAPDFSGEPEPLPEESGEGEKTYFYKKTA
jgi:hypothetical protein